MPIKGYAEWADNPRDTSKNRIDAIGDSMAEFGDVGGIVLNRRTKTIVGGHQRVKNLPPDAEPVVVEELDEPTPSGTVALGYVDHAGDRWPVRFVDWPDDKAEAAALAANFHGERAWVLKKLNAPLLRAAEKYGRKTIGAGHKDMAFARSNTALAKATEALAKPACHTDDPDSQTGEVYELEGRDGLVHRIVCGDAGNPEHVALAVGPHRPYFAVADPPYGVGFDPNWRKTEIHHPHGEKMLAYEEGDAPVDARFDAVWAALPDSIDVLYVWHAATMGHHLRHAVEAHRFTTTYAFVWVKNAAPMARGHVNYLHEECTRFHKLKDDVDEPPPGHENLTGFIRNGRKRHWKKAGVVEGGREHSVWNMQKPMQTLGHGATKPIMAYQRPIRLHVAPEQRRPDILPVRRQRHRVRRRRPVGRAGERRRDQPRLRGPDPQPLRPVHDRLPRRPARWRPSTSPSSATREPDS